MPRNEESVATKLQRIAEKARSDPKCRFTSLFHLMNRELLWECFWQLKDARASGIDRVTKEQYAEHLMENLDALIWRLHRMAYVPQPVRWVYIPKPGSDKQRPLGIPVLEDKLVQAGLSKILEAIYEEDFVEDSYGFRPGRSCHDALRVLGRTIERQGTQYVVEADIKAFFDNVDQDQLMGFLAHRVADKRVLRYIRRFLKAGIQEDGVYRASDRGTPQGGVISPLLANLYLHYTLDLWFQRRFQPGCTGSVRLIRYADDYVASFKHEVDAKRFRIEMEKRLGLYELEIAPEKTRILAFGPMAQQWAKEQGRRKAETFDFLGFTHYCTTSRNGKWFRVGRKTISRRLSVVKNVRPGLMLSDKTLRLVPKKESVVERFLYQNLLSRIYRKYIETAVGGTEAKNISQARLKKAPIWLPSLETQEAVTKTLISFDQTIEQAETNIESACLMLRALISNWVEVLHV